MKKQFHLILSPIFVMAVFAIVFAINGLFPFGDKSLSWCDMNQQVIPLFCNFKDILRGESGFFLNLNNSGGMNFYGVFFFFLSSPFTFLVAFVEKADIPFLMNILVVLKLCASAVTAGIYLSKKNPSLCGYIKTALCVSYALCGYGMLFYQNIIWLDIMYLFPILLLGMDMLIEGKPLLFTLSLSGIIIVNYYISYMVILFVVLMFGLYGIFHRFKEPIIYVRLGIGTLCSLLISAVVWLPSLIQYFGSGRTSDIIYSLKSCFFFSYTDTSLPVMLCTGIIFAVLVLTIPRFYEQTQRVKMLLCAFLMMCVPIFIEPVNRMWHTGNYMSFPVRYGFITVFLGLCITADVLEKHKGTIHSKPFFALLSIAASLGIGAFLVSYSKKNLSTLSHYVQTLWGNKQSLQGLLILFICAAAVYLLVITLAKYKKIGNGVLSLCLIILVFAEGLWGTTVYVGTAKNKLDTEDFAEFTEVSDWVADNGFYRVNMSSKIADANMTGALGFNSLGHYTSLTDSNYMKAAKQFGLSGYWMEIGNWGGSILSDALLSVDCEIFRYEDSYAVAQTLGALDLGVGSAVKLPEELPDGDRIFVLGEYFAQMFALKSNPVTRYEPTSLKGCLYDNANEQHYISITESDSEIIYNITFSDEQALYFDCYNGSSNALYEPINGSFDIYVNDNLVFSSYPAQNYNAPLELGFFGKQTVTVKVKAKKSVNCFSFGVFGVDTAAVKAVTDNAEASRFNVSANKITATLSDADIGEMFLSLPYSKGYKITLNGEKINYYRCLTGFTGITIKNPGELKITFMPPAFTLGAILSVIGVLFASLFFMLNKKIHLIPKWIKRYTCILFSMIFNVFILAVYIGPVILNLIS